MYVIVTHECQEFIRDETGEVDTCCHENKVQVSMTHYSAEPETGTPEDWDIEDNEAICERCGSPFEVSLEAGIKAAEEYCPY